MTTSTANSEAGAHEHERGRERVEIRTVAGRKLRVAVREGDADQPPLLLCTGIGARLELLQPFIDALNPRRAIIRFDLPGIGGSPAPVMPYHLATLPRLVTGLLDGLGHQAVDVLGISWGGGLAQQFALTHPSRVRRLVLVATGTGTVMVPAHPRVLRRLITPRRHHDAQYAVEIAGDIYGGSLRQHPLRVSALLHGDGTAPPHQRQRRGYYYQLLAGLGWCSLPLLPLLRTPTLVLAGDDDPLIPLPNALMMRKLIPNSTLHIYRGGHLELVADPHRFARVIEAFLDEAADHAAG
jgi:poly(3-hydroxyalkanoate) depolymerase